MIQFIGFRRLSLFKEETFQIPFRTYARAIFGFSTFISILCIHQTSYSNDLSRDLTQLFGSVMQSMVPLPKDQASGRSYTSAVGSYSYVSFDHSIDDQDLHLLETFFLNRGYQPLGRNVNRKNKDTLVAQCKVNLEVFRDNGNRNSRIYKGTSTCRLIDHDRDNFIVYEGRGVSYGFENIARVKSILLSFIRMENGVERKPIFVEVHGYDDGTKSDRKKDYDEALSHAKWQAMERAGIVISGKQSLSSEYSSRKGIVDDNFREVIETKSAAVLQPGYVIEDLGYEDSSYHVILKGYIVPDPVDYIPKYSALYSSNIFANKDVQNAFEFEKTGSVIRLSEGYNLTITKTFVERSCREFVLNNESGLSVRGIGCRKVNGIWDGNISQ